MSSRRFREEVLHEFSACGQRGRWTRRNRPAPAAWRKSVELLPPKRRRPPRGPPRRTLPGTPPPRRRSPDTPEPSNARSAVAYTRRVFSDIDALASTLAASTPAGSLPGVFVMVAFRVDSDGVVSVVMVRSQLAQPANCPKAFDDGQFIHILDTLIKNSVFFDIMWRVRVSPTQRKSMMDPYAKLSAFEENAAALEPLTAAGPPPAVLSNGTEDMPASRLNGLASPSTAFAHH